MGTLLKGHLLAIAVTVALPLTSARADWKKDAAKVTALNTGGVFYENCSDPVARELCAGLLQSLNEGILLGIFYRTLIDGNPTDRKSLERVLPYCLPPGMDKYQLFDVFMKFLRDNPQVHDEPTTHIFLGGLNKIFPGPQSGGCPE